MNTQIQFIVDLLSKHFQDTQIQVDTPNIMILLGKGVGIQLTVLEKEVLISMNNVYWGFSKGNNVAVKHALTDIEAILLAGNINYSILQRNSANL